MPQPKPQYFPVCLDLTGRPCTVIGGGRVAARKVASLLEHGASVRLISPTLVAGLSRLAEAGTIEWLTRPYQDGDLADAFLVIAATDDPAVQDRVYAEAQRRNSLVNVADVPKRCNFILPATARRGDLSISISTAGRSPAFASRLRREMEEQFGPEYAVLLDILGELRELVLAEGRPHSENKTILADLADPTLAAWIRDGLWDKLKSHLRRVLGPQISLACLDAAKEQHSTPSGAAP